MLGGEQLANHSVELLFADAVVLVRVDAVKEAAHLLLGVVAGVARPLEQVVQEPVQLRYIQASRPVHVVDRPKLIDVLDDLLLVHLLIIIHTSWLTIYLHKILFYHKI